MKQFTFAAETFADFDLNSLLAGYRSQKFSPVDVVQEVLNRIESRTSNAEWTYLVSKEDLLQRAFALQTKNTNMPLYGIPFSVKDNIHVQGMPTTAGCAAFSHYPQITSPVVQKLLELGAILIGKNTMDEFATGVVGVRSSPHPVNPFNAEYIPGGSSSGSAVVVAKKCVSFALGSDTGGSGRVPAALCNVVGFKPTPHLLSNEAMVYANQSIDCIPIFSKTVREAKYIFELLVNDVSHSELAPETSGTHAQASFANLRIAIPDVNGLKFFGDEHSRQSFDRVIKKLESLGSQFVEIDFQPFYLAGNLLFEGAYLNERFSSVGHFIENNTSAVNEVVAKVICSAQAVSTEQIWQDTYKLNHYRVLVEKTLQEVDVLLTPTTGSTYKISQMNKEPIKLNQSMAYYTNFGNLLHLAVVSVPAYFRDDGLPFGISFMAPMLSDQKVLEYAQAWQTLSEISPGV